MAAPPGGAPVDALLISFKALERAQHTIEDFVQTYFPLHGLDPLKDFLRWWNVLVWVEGVIYQADEDNEAATAATPGSSDGGGAATGPAPGEPAASGLAALGAVLRERGLLTPGVQAELEAGRHYWREERRLCGLMQRCASIPRDGHGAGAGFTLEEVLAASERKSFDYRLLHQLLCALAGLAPDPALLAFCRADELLVDIGDDLLDLEDDICVGGPAGAGSFNVYRAYTHLYGAAAPLRLAQRIGELEAARDAALAALPPAVQAHVRARTADAAEEGEGALRWQMPAVVLDEAAFRRQYA